LDAAVKRSADRCWLGEFIDRPILQLSKGMRQRVGLADAIMHDPEVLILDEPTIGLDPTQIRETRNLLRELGERHTILLSSHILQEVERTCSRAIIIGNGKIVASGTIQELRNMVSGKARIIAELCGPRQEIELSLRSLTGVAAVQSSGENGWVRLSVEPKENQDVREDIFRMTTAKGWSLREIRREEVALEDFFVQVVAQQAGARRRNQE
jgi:ABC-2 type transport system ATP-binding protein